MGPGEIMTASTRQSTVGGGLTRPSHLLPGGHHFTGGVGTMATRPRESRGRVGAWERGTRERTPLTRVWRSPSLLGVTLVAFASVSVHTIEFSFGEYNVTSWCTHSFLHGEGVEHWIVQDYISSICISMYTAMYVFQLYGHLQWLQYTCKLILDNSQYTS